MFHMTAGFLGKMISAGHGHDVAAEYNVPKTHKSGTGSNADLAHLHREASDGLQQITTNGEAFPALSLIGSCTGQAGGLGDADGRTSIASREPSSVSSASVLLAAALKFTSSAR